VGVNQASARRLDVYALGMTTTPEYVALDAALLERKHRAGVDYDAYLASDAEKAQRWRELQSKVALTPPQRQLLAAFTREMKVICVSGIWCGDCVAQGPMLDAIAAANPKTIDLKWLDRDEHMDLSNLIKINAGLRVPTVIFMAEDFQPVSIVGDRTLTRYRAIAARQLGPSCPLPGAPIPQDELNATLQEWVNEFERVQLLLRLSTRLREKHGD
jgi:thiol-disulfide isomerase/thioredoxin